MKKILPVIILSLLIASCTTMPAEIEDKYLTEKTEPESKTIFSLEAKIIDKNKEKQDVENKLKNQTKQPAGIEEEIKLLKNESESLKDQVAFYEKNKDAVNLESKKTQLAENEKKLTAKTALFEFEKSEKKLFEAELAVKEAELGQNIAELNVEKSKIAATYRDKNEPAKPEEEGNFFTKLFNKKDPNDKYGYKKYNEYLDKKKKDTAKAEAEYREATKIYQDAKINLDKTK